MAIPEVRFDAKQMCGIATERFNSIADQNMVNSIKSLSESLAGGLLDKFGLSDIASTLGNLTSGTGIQDLLKGAGNLLGAGKLTDLLGGAIGSFSSLMPNTSNMLSSVFSMFTTGGNGSIGSSLCNHEHLSLREEAYNNSLYRGLNFRINDNLCLLGILGNPLGSILNSIKSLDRIPSMIPSLDTGILMNYVRQFGDSLLGGLGLPAEISNCLYNKSLLNLSGITFGNFGPLVDRLGLIDALNDLTGCNFSGGGKANLLYKNKEVASVFNSKVLSQLYGNMSNFGSEQSKYVYDNIIKQNKASIGDNRRGATDSIYTSGTNADEKLKLIKHIEENDSTVYSKVYTTNNPLPIYNNIVAEKEEYIIADDDELWGRGWSVKKTQRYIDSLNLLSNVFSKWDEIKDNHIQNDRIFAGYIKSIAANKQPVLGDEIDNTVYNNELTRDDKTLLASMFV